LGCARGRRRWLPGGASSGTLGSPPPAAAPSHSPAASSLAPPPAAALAGANAGGDGRGRQRRGVTRAVAARLALLAPFPRRWRWAGRNGSKGTPGAGSAAAGHGPLFSLCRSHSGGDRGHCSPAARRLPEVGVQDCCLERRRRQHARAGRWPPGGGRHHALWHARGQPEATQAACRVGPQTPAGAAAGAGSSPRGRLLRKRMIALLGAYPGHLCGRKFRPVQCSGER
jgi:hypothetical protein